MTKFLSLYIILFLSLACRQQSGKKEVSVNNKSEENKPTIKPPTIFSDTLKVDSKAAVFYYPDSLQLKKIRAGSDTAKFDAVMHEYFYEFRYVHSLLNKYWPDIKVVEAKNVRYLLFIKVDKSRKIIDLDAKYDPYGLLIFDPQKDPSQLELTNAASEIGFYFSETIHNERK